MPTEFDMMSSLSVSLEKFQDEADAADRRQSFRTYCFGVKTQERGKELRKFEVRDLSSHGICFDAPPGTYVKGDKLLLHLTIADKVYLSDLEAYVVRAADQECACAFQNMARPKELKLDKLILEMQKRHIIQRKQERDAKYVNHYSTNTAKTSGEEAPPPVINLPW